MLELAVDELSAQQLLRTRLQSQTLPAGCTLHEPFIERASVAGLNLHMVGLVAVTPGGREITGAAADAAGFPVDRALFELIERICVVSASTTDEPLAVRDLSGEQQALRPASELFPRDTRPESLRASLSNGAALHDSWANACNAAAYELIERDRILRSFRGDFAPRRLPLTERSISRALQDHYDLEFYRLDPPEDPAQIAVAAVFLFPHSASAPLVYGFAANRHAPSAETLAMHEALQRLAFLWGEPNPTTPPTASPTPEYHQEFYLYPPNHALLRSWLKGGGMRLNGPLQPLFDLSQICFVDLKPTGVDLEYAVAKAYAPDALVLQFGTEQGSSLRPPHPIP
jgi:hypothetical protein